MKKQERELTNCERLSLTGTTTAVTYTFRAERLGWSCCTINESTGELSITSDWGNWSHRWGVNHLGEPSLHAFIGRGSLDYLAGKLCREISEFCAEKTVADLKGRILERRREMVIDKGTARGAWQDLEDLESDAGDNAQLFGERFYAYQDAVEALGLRDVVWEYFLTRHTAEYLSLTEIVLPPLVVVCAAEAPKHAREQAA